MRTPESYKWSKGERHQNAIPAFNATGVENVLPRIGPTIPNRPSCPESPWGGHAYH